jgi:mono/diheme cytochrome c family protein
MNLRATILTGVVSTALAFSVFAFSGLAQTTASSAPAKQQQSASAAVAKDTRVHDGQKVFEQNCGRCHNAPQGFPPSISGTVSRHMRARASLSQEDYQAILHFLNP